MKSRRAQSGSPQQAEHEKSSGKVPWSPWSYFSHAAIRETIEQVIVAVVLAFLIRTFEAEAFVIPTGSMAPALMGAHKDLVCKKCGYPYQVSASDKQDGKPAVVQSTICPICRSHETLTGSDRTTYSGDRVLVDKFCYQLRPLEPWDVVVFHNPADAAKNYIKRLVGRPNETIHIAHGALWIRSKGEPMSKEQIARKPPEKLLAMLEPVFDNDYLRGKWESLGLPRRWSGKGWKSVDEGGYDVFKTEDDAPDGAWLRYRHLVPSFDMAAGKMRTERKPALISDFLAYDAGEGEREQKPPAILGLNWVGDLALECTLESRSDQGQAVFELVKGGRQFQCRFDLSNGEAALSISDVGAEQFHPTAMTSVKGKGTHRILFSNADDQLLLWIDGRLVPASKEKADGRWSATTCYDSRKLNIYVPTKADLEPVGIAGMGGAALTVSHLKIMRNIYYIADDLAHQLAYSIADDAVRPLAGCNPHGGIVEFTDGCPDLTLADPTTWDRFEQRSEERGIFLGAGPVLHVGRQQRLQPRRTLWERPYWVDRDLIIGKAIVIYWPHSWDEVTIGGHTFPSRLSELPQDGFVRERIISRQELPLD